jgi:glutathione S-transferase
MALQLYIGNKNYSSWSMRPWVLMRQLRIEFDEVKLQLAFDEKSAFKQTLAGINPAGKVPVLVDDGFAVWDTLAITEYLHERAGSRGVWPAAAQDRARARSLCAEMHSGFNALRNLCPMNIEASLGDVGRRLWADKAELRHDVARIEQMWAPLLQAHGGPMLFAEFSAIDAFFAPVCSRLRTYALPVSGAVAAYVERVWALDSVQQWFCDSLAEHDFLDFDEPYRTRPGTTA